jgi:DNA processing protein
VIGDRGRGSATGACDACVTRAWLLARMAGHLENARGRIDAVMALADHELIEAIGGAKRERLRDELDGLDVEAARRRSRADGVELVCRCDPAYPARLYELEAPPAVLHVSGGVDRLLALLSDDPVAIVGARAASPYGAEMARSLGHSLGRAGVTVLSGMANGIDSAAHTGALDAGAATLAVLPGPPNRPYPPGKRTLHRRLLANGTTVSELPPGATVRRWTFPARNRIIAAFCAMTVVVEAGERSGALVTAGYASALGRPVGAVPGRVTTRQAAGPNELLAAGATVVRGAQDVLDAVFGAGARVAAAADRPELGGELSRLLAAIANGHDTAAALVRAGVAPERGLAALASLELTGYVRRQPGGRYSVIQ